MNVSSVSPASFPEPTSATDTNPRPQTAEQASKRAELVQAVKTVNDSRTLGDNSELTFILDRTTHRMITRVIDRTTKEVVMQIPPQYVLDLAKQIKDKTSA